MNNLNEKNFLEINSESIMNDNFDDIKQSEYFQDIIELWDGMGFVEGIEGEKHDNVCIAFSQMSIFLDNKPTEELNMISDNIKFNEMKEYLNIDNQNNEFPMFFEVISFPLIRRIYDVLPLSDYDYKEIIDSLKRIKVDDNDFNGKAENETDKEAFYVTYIADKITNLISSK